MTYFLLRPPFEAIFKFFILRRGITTLAGVISSPPLFFCGLGVYIVLLIYSPSSYLLTFCLPVPIRSDMILLRLGDFPLFGVLPLFGVFPRLGVLFLIFTSLTIFLVSGNEEMFTTLSLFKYSY